MAPTTTTSKASSKARRLILSLVMAAVSLVLLTSPASAAVNANSSTVTVDEGSLAANNGTYFNPLSIPFNTTITANVGSVSKTGTTSGTWSWSFTPDDGSSNSQNVSITANHSGFNGSSTESVTFRLNVNNVAPTATFNAPPSVGVGDPINLSVTGATDASEADRAAGFQYAFDCGDGSGYGDFSTTSTASCPTSDPGTRTVKGKVRDKDGGEREYTHAVTINDTTAPKVKRVVPMENATGIAPGANVSAFFSEAMRAFSVNNAFKLCKKGSTTAITATVTYDAATKRAVLDPSANLERGASYRAVVSTAARDLAGNQLDQNPTLTGNHQKVWFFTIKP